MTDHHELAALQRELTTIKRDLDVLVVAMRYRMDMLTSRISRQAAEREADDDEPDYDRNGDYLQQQRDRLAETRR